MARTLSVPSILLLLCSPFVSAAAPEPDAAEVARGEYLVSILACGRCHTEGYLTGQSPTGPHLAGSQIGIAYSGYQGEKDQPGLVFPRNLTPDPETGIGSWSKDDIVRALTTGMSPGGHQNLPVMPSANYASLHEDDLRAIAAYLKRVPPVSRKIPARTAPGAPPEHAYVRFGIYVFDPSGGVGERPLP